MKQSLSIREIAVTVLLEYLDFHACFMLASGYISGRSRRVLVVSTETPFEICVLSCQKMKYFNRTVTSRYSITVI